MEEFRSIWGAWRKCPDAPGRRPWVEQVRSGGLGVGRRGGVHSSVPIVPGMYCWAADPGKSGTMGTSDEWNSEAWTMLALHALRPLREPSPPPWAWDTYRHGKSTDIVPASSLSFEP